MALAAAFLANACARFVLPVRRGERCGGGAACGDSLGDCLGDSLGDCLADSLGDRLGNVFLEVSLEDLF